MEPLSKNQFDSISRFIISNGGNIGNFMFHTMFHPTEGALNSKKTNVQLTKEQIDAVAEWMTTSKWGILGLHEAMTEIRDRFIIEFSPKDKENELKFGEKPTAYILQKDLPDAKAGSLFVKKTHEGDMARLLPNEYYYQNITTFGRCYNKEYVENQPTWFLPEKKEEKALPVFSESLKNYITEKLSEDIDAFKYAVNNAANKECRDGFEEKLAKLEAYYNEIHK